MRYDRVIEYRHRSLLYGFSGRKCRIRGTAYYGRSTQTPPRNHRIRLCTHVCLCLSCPLFPFCPCPSIRLSLSFYPAPRARLGFPAHIRVNGPRWPYSPSSADHLNVSFAPKNVDIIFPLFDRVPKMDPIRE